MYQTNKYTPSLNLNVILKFFFLIYRTIYKYINKYTYISI